MSLFQRLSDVKIQPQLQQILASPETIVQFDAARKTPKLLEFSGTATCVRLQAFGVKSGSLGKLIVFKDVTRRET